MYAVTQLVMWLSKPEFEPSALPDMDTITTMMRRFGASFSFMKNSLLAPSHGQLATLSHSLYWKKQSKSSKGRYDHCDDRNY
jgi:hypothetical protein